MVRGALSPRQRLIVALGLAHAVSPSHRTRLPLRKFCEIRNLKGLKEALPNPPLLRRDRQGDIFSGNFPDWADKEIRRARDEGVAMVTWEGAGYPERLDRLADPPPHLYIQGGFGGAAPAGVAVAVVGSRRATAYGRRMALELGRGLAQAGAAVISGLARGIDTKAHEGAIEAGGRTIGVLGTGIDVVYPSEGRTLFGKVRAAGALLTEFPFGSHPEPWHFPVRNRIIAALSDAVVVVEATRDSGSLITAALAAECGIPVGAAPGMAGHPSSEGCNELIHDGAALVRGVEDVVGMLDYGARRRMGAGRPAADPAPAPGLAPADREVLEALSRDLPRHPDALADTLRRAPADLLGTLLDLELRGLVDHRPDGSFLRKH